MPKDPWLVKAEIKLGPGFLTPGPVSLPLCHCVCVGGGAMRTSKHAALDAVPPTVKGADDKWLFKAIAISWITRYSQFTFFLQDDEAISRLPAAEWIDLVSSGIWQTLPFLPDAASCFCFCFFKFNFCYLRCS